MRKPTIIIAAIFIIALAGAAGADSAYIDDGGNHVLNDSTYQNSNLFIDLNVANNPGTHVELTNGGIVLGIILNNNSTAQIGGGLLKGNLDAHNNSVVTVSGGTMNSYVNAIDNSTITISGGVMNERIRVWNSGTIKIGGGTLNSYIAADDGTIYLYGSNFKVGEVNLNIGDSLRNYGVLDSYGMWLNNTITGTLQDGSTLNIHYYALNNTDGDIIVVPEPATILLIGLGAVAMRKKD